MPGLPYSQDNKKFVVDKATGNIHSEMNTPGVRMAYAARLFLKMVHETGQIGRVATKPTQAKEDAVNAGIMRWLLQGTKFKLKRSYAVDAYAETNGALGAALDVVRADLHGHQAHRVVRRQPRARDEALRDQRAHVRVIAAVPLAAACGSKTMQATKVVAVAKTTTSSSTVPQPPTQPARRGFTGEVPS